MLILEEVLKRLREAGLKINFDKCNWCRKSLVYLGHLIDGRGISVDPEKVNAIVNLPLPKTKTQLKSVLGMFSFYRRFLKDYSTVAAPLHHLLKKNIRWHWANSQHMAYCKLKSMLIEAPILTTPDYDQVFKIHCDSSDYGLGGVLTQGDGPDEKVIAFISRTLSPCERKRHTTERELMAVLFAVQKFRQYIEGYKFEIITDHAALVWLHNHTNPSSKMMRWALELQQYDYTVTHRAGKEHYVPDALSRVPLPPRDNKYEESSEEGSVVSLCDGNPVLKCDSFLPRTLQPSSDLKCNILISTESEEYQSLIDKIKELPEKYSQYSIVDNKIYFKSHVTDPARLYIASPDRNAILYECHDDPLAGHVGVFKTYKKIAVNYYWPNMYQTVKAYVNKCVICQTCKYSTTVPYGQMGAGFIPNGPWKVISTDICEFVRSSKGHRYLLAFIDNFTKYIELIPMRDATTKNVRDAFQKYVLFRWGTPKFVHMDNGAQYRSALFTDICKEFDIKMSYTPVYHPQANKTERLNRVIKTMVRSYLKDNHRKWDENIDKVMFAINTSVHNVTGFTPYYLNHGREADVPSSLKHVIDQSNDEIEDVAVKDYSKIMESLKDVYVIVRDNLCKAHAVTKHSYNLRHKPMNYKIGDQVWKKNIVQSNAAKYFSAKLAPIHVGPYTVTEVVSPVIVKLSSSKGNIGFWHIKDLKRVKA
jgi:transposase InsO family protein